jgi:hypothetical protein
MYSPTSILLLLSLLPATPSRDLKLSGRPPAASLTPGLLTPRFTRIATSANDLAFGLGADALEEESEEEGLEVQEQAYLALIEELDVGSHVLFPGSFPTPHACLSIDRTQCPRGPPWIIFSRLNHCA